MDFSFAGLKTAVMTRCRALGSQPPTAALADLAWVPADRAWLSALRGRLTR